MIPYRDSESPHSPAIIAGQWSRCQVRREAAKGCSVPSPEFNGPSSLPCLTDGDVLTWPRENGRFRQAEKGRRGKSAWNVVGPDTWVPPA